MTYTMYHNSKNAYLVHAIIETENLDLSWSTFENALGDTMIAVDGSKEEVRTFIEIYRMVGGE